jgi:ferrochelatase
MSHVPGDTAVLIMAFGGPSRLDEVEGFLSRFLGGRLPSRERIEEIVEKYRLIGGASPLTGITLRQAEALEAELTRRGYELKVLAGMRFSEPFIEEAVSRMKASGVRQVIALPLAPHRSKFSTATYFTRLDEAMDKVGARFRVFEATGWHAHPLFVAALEEKVRDALSRFSSDDRHPVQVLFTAHSLPERVVSNDSYVEDIHDTIRGVLDRVGPFGWRLAFQSRGGGSDAWLEPDVRAVLQELCHNGYQRVLVVPVGFVSDHLETLYDLDIKHREEAEALGMHYERSESLNDSARFIQALAQVVSDLSDSIETSRR